MRLITTLLACTTAIAASACASASRSPAPRAADAPPPVEREFRGVWVASVANLDWPSVPGLPPDSQRAELVRMLDRARDLRLNAVILQVRPAADALYPSSLEPWSEWLTGEQGRAPDPLYDPLQFAVEQAHARGLELHAWFNPYRAWHASASRGEPAATHISRTNPELVRRYGGYLWMDPGEDAVRQRSIDVVMDVVRRYDVDGVHIDDYFYPYRERDAAGNEIDFPDSVSYARYRSGGGTLERNDWRRNNVDRYVEEMYEAVKRVKPHVKVGVSPIGSWRPNVAPQIVGFDAYESIYADARKWLMDGSLDYMVPQIYWPIARTDVSFPVMLDWWVRQNVRGRGMYAGLIPSNVNIPGARNVWPPEEIIGQVYVTRGRPGADGHVHFRMGSLMKDDTLVTRLRDEAYARPALVPLMPWLDDTPPPAPHVVLQRDVAHTRLVLTPGAGEAVTQWVVQSRWTGAWHTELVPAHVREWDVGSMIRAATGTPDAVWVSAVDRLGNQSRAVPVRR